MNKKSSKLFILPLLFCSFSLTGCDTSSINIFNKKVPEILYGGE